MSGILIAGTIIVNFALLFYTIGIVSEQRSHRVTRRTLFFLTVGVVFDVVATGFMIVGSSHGPFTTHGLLGFSSLAAMLLETTFAWRHHNRAGDELVPGWLHNYSRLAYTWWVVAYITGAILVMSKRG
ncbi:MAG: hypothetical protein WBH85_05225 [Thermoanaerobaculia bacterium]